MDKLYDDYKLGWWAGFWVRLPVRLGKVKCAAICVGLCAALQLFLFCEEWQIRLRLASVKVNAWVGLKCCRKGLRLTFCSYKKLAFGAQNFPHTPNLNRCTNV